MSEVDAKAVKRLADILIEKDLSEIEYEYGEWRIRVCRQKKTHETYVPSFVAPTPPEHKVIAEKSLEVEEGEIIKSPMVGTVYLSPEPNAPAFIKVGDTIKKDQTLMIIEAMKVMNPFKSPCDGVIKKIVVHDAKPVEFGEALLIMDAK